MKAMLFNDTSLYHGGCKKSMKYLHRKIKEKWDLVGSVLSGPKFHEKMRKGGELYDREKFTAADVVIVNGEGTMHHDRPTALFYLELLQKAKQQGKVAMLVNMVWQEMTNDYDSLLKVLDFVSVREVKSKRELFERHGVDVPVFLDCSFFADVLVNECEGVESVSGDVISRGPLPDDFGERRSLFTESWDSFVNLLRVSDVLVTGRQHEVYAACKARCFFVALSGNTHKIEGLIQSAGVGIEVCASDASDDEVLSARNALDKHREQFGRLFDFMEAQPEFSFDGAS